MFSMQIVTAIQDTYLKFKFSLRFPQNIQKLRSMVELSVLVCCFSNDYLNKKGCGLGVVTKVTPLLKSLRTPLVMHVLFGCMLIGGG